MKFFSLTLHTNLAVSREIADGFGITVSQVEDSKLARRQTTIPKLIGDEQMFDRHHPLSKKQFYKPNSESAFLEVILVIPVILCLKPLLLNDFRE